MVTPTGPCESPPINRNMRCIEIGKQNFHLLLRHRINRNMRCIEIGVKTKDGYEIMRLIET